MYTESSLREAAAHLPLTPDAKRLERAIRIILDGEIHLLPSGNWGAKSHSLGQPVEYQVNPKSEECNCPDFRNGHICKHWLAFEIIRALPPEPRPLVTLDQFMQSVGW